MSSLLARCRALSNRLVVWILSLIPINFLIRSCLRWLAFDASKRQLQDIMCLCEALLPIARSASQAAQLREVYAIACEQNVCTPELQAEVIEVTKFMRSTTELALSAFFRALDADGDGKVSLAEALAAWQATEARDVSAEGGSAMAPSAATMLEAMRRAQSAIDELEQLKFSASLALEGAIASVDADGDGQVSLQEALQAPGRIGAWLGTWRRLMNSGKV